MYLSILLVEYPDGGDSIDLDIVSADTSELFTEVVDESLGWFLVRVEDDALVSETDQLDVLHLEDVTVGGWTGHQGGMSEIWDSPQLKTVLIVDYLNTVAVKNNFL